mmetsp:Transcript_72401/g.203278  ORF Transcript_72401/g.203278 Transcript_72401/m.203278 type:complete len:216 (-) Transcript_72401:17-664(-)
MCAWMARFTRVTSLVNSCDAFRMLSNSSSGRTSGPKLPSLPDTVCIPSVTELFRNSELFRRVDLIVRTADVVLAEPSSSIFCSCSANVGVRARYFRMIAWHTWSCVDNCSKTWFEWNAASRSAGDKSATKVRTACEMICTVLARLPISWVFSSTRPRSSPMLETASNNPHSTSMLRRNTQQRAADERHACKQNAKNPSASSPRAQAFAANPTVCA